MKVLWICLALVVSPALWAQTDSDATDSDTRVATDDDYEEVQKATGVFDPWPRWYLTVGATYLGANGAYSLYVPEVGTIPVLDFDTIGLSKRDASHYLSINWRSQQNRWGLWFANWRFDATGGREWSENIPVEGIGDIPVGAAVVSNFDAEFYIAEVTFSLFRNERLDVGVGLGVHAVDLKTNIAASVSIGDFEREVFAEELDELAPLPNVAGYAAWRIKPWMSLTGRLGWFGLSYDKYDGQMLNAHALLDFHLSRHWTLGVGYQFVHLDLTIDEIEEEGYSDIYDIDFDGPIAYLTLTF